MNNIVVRDKNIVSDDNKVDISNNNILIKLDGQYILSYKQDSKYDINIEVLPNLKVKIYIDNLGYNLSHKINYIIRENSHVKISKFYRGKEIKEDIIIDLEKNSALDYYFSSYACYKNKYNFIIHHKYENSKSNVVNHFLCNKEGNVNINIDSYASKKAIKSILNQDTKIINMHDNSSSINPNMYIDIDDIEAKHSSVIGSFPKDYLFYFMSRGICENKALKLLSKGFLLGNFRSDDKFMEIINKSLNDI